MKVFLVIAALLFGLPAFAQSQSIDIRPDAERVVGDELLEAFMGVTHDGAYNFNMAGQARDRYRETHNDDGTTDYIEGDYVQKGAWIIRKDALCFWYPDLNGGCFRVWRVDNCYYYYSDTQPEREDEIQEEYWTARSVKRGENASCEARFM